MNTLSRIQKIELRKAWNHEASDFTNWLAEEENLKLLSDEIGIEIKLIQTEANVGKFNVDILAQEEGTEHKIIIENQLEATNHDHLGKIITYASGFDAKMIIWIVKEAREEHRQAIDWLNEHTDEDLYFFLVKVELWQIADSPLAPKFEVISKPNDWAKTVKQSVLGGTITDTKAKQLEFWEQFKEFAQKHNTTLHLGRSPRPQHWLNMNVSCGFAHISLTLNSFEGVIRTELYIPDKKDAFYFLEKSKNDIEKELSGYRVIWMELPDKKASRIRVETPGLIENINEWEKYFTWLQATAEIFYKVFSKRLKKFK